MVALTRFVLSASLAGLAAAQGLQITNPSANSWWVAKSANTFSWTCNSSPQSQFTVLVSNSNPAILVSPIAIIAIESNVDCSKLITQDQSNQPASGGYRIILANPLNSSDIYAQSDEFEIKPLGSAYPSTTPATGPSATSASGAAASGSAAPQNGQNNAASIKNAGFGVGAAIAAGLAYFL
ncbi:hypothetical protein P691DRAFT_776716 [Macrolepiota fuliginosa MF-IS2]|uniref:Yeast cell wall synthesis Kre9/Knh1-like N-terminal domain-containing protein n=1 Tax=Macrolepiota fuliginosa MF-IS2 TaxID=1400762 RepID=A0A9P5XC65_9AGAR|nr:hypothetical protein P691DRAFT_776716 [Macrolepiota fuliginosa MF-IS2]